MFTRQPPDTRVVLALIIALFLALMAWWWSVRAGRIDINTAPTPATSPAVTAPGPGTPVVR